MVKGREMTTNAALLCLALCAGTFTTANATQAAQAAQGKQMTALMDKLTAAGAALQ